jgi:hypothetical protein
VGLDQGVAVRDAEPVGLDEGVALGDVELIGLADLGDEPVN